jgi:preprotein translocase subunit YajC
MLPLFINHLILGSGIGTGLGAIGTGTVDAVSSLVGGKEDEGIVDNSVENEYLASLGINYHDFSISIYIFQLIIFLTLIEKEKRKMERFRDSYKNIKVNDQQHILITGINGDVENCQYATVELRKRGFKLEYVYIDKESNIATFCLSLSKKLTFKLALANGIKLKVLYISS